MQSCLFQSDPRSPRITGDWLSRYLGRVGFKVHTEIDVEALRIEP